MLRRPKPKVHIIGILAVATCHHLPRTSAFKAPPHLFSRHPSPSLSLSLSRSQLLRGTSVFTTCHPPSRACARSFYGTRMALGEEDKLGTMMTPLQQQKLQFEQAQLEADAQRRQYGVSTKDVLQGLNQAQQQAVSAPFGPLLVLAGPGSGKTRVLTHRVGFLLGSGESASSILTVTFTNKAANEMRKRIKGMLGIKNDSDLEITVGTFHGVCMKILREHGSLVGLEPGFTIFDAGQQKELVEQAMLELNWDTEKFKPAAIRGDISKLKSEGLPPEECMSSSTIMTAAIRGEQQRKLREGYMQRVGSVYQLYQAELAKSNAVDFDDLLLKTKTLLQLYDDVRDELRSRWKHVLVDEWQDTNSPQYDLVKLLAGEGDMPSVLVVGDVDQSIYGFRGADIRNIYRFEDDFRGVRRILLEHNYRSSANIVGCAQAVIEKSIQRVNKGMITTKQEGQSVKVREAYDETDEAEFVARKTRFLVEGEEVEGGYREVAVMYRTNQQSRILEEQFVKCGVPYHLVGAKKFYERKEVKDLLAYLRVLVSSVSPRTLKTLNKGLGWQPS
jgi:DNA helicase-2/ATP-dependent DNA helicase PcrA